MRGRKTTLVVTLNDDERHQLDKLVRATTTPAGLLRRARAVALVADGHTLVEAGRQAGMTEKYVRRWVKRFQDGRLTALTDRPRPGRPARFSPRSAGPSGQNRL